MLSPILKGMYGYDMKQARDIYWGWFVVAGAFLILSVNYGTRYGFGIFVKPMALDYHWSRSVISLGYSLNMLVYSTSCIYIGRMLEKTPPRWIITCGALLAAIGLISTSMARTPIQFYIAYGVIFGVGSACMSVVVFNTMISRWFIRKRGLAIGIATMGISFGTILLSPAAGLFVKYYGWQSGFLFMGILSLVIGVSLSQLLMRKTYPEAHGMLPDGEKEAGHAIRLQPEPSPPIKLPLSAILTDPRFCILGACFFLAIAANMSVFVHQVPFALDNHIEKIAAASSLGAIGLAAFCGQFFFGWLSDRLRDVKFAAAFGLIIMAAGMILLLKATTVPRLYIFAIVFGFGYGSLAPMIPVLVVDRFGRFAMGSVYGLLTFCIGIGGAVGPILGGIIFDTLGSYTYVWQSNFIMFTVAALLILTLKKDRAVS